MALAERPGAPPPWRRWQGRGPGRRRLFRLVAGTLVVLTVVSLLWVVAYRIVAVPVTALMLQRIAEGDGATRQWVSIEAISPSLIDAVIASEDSRFCFHHGFDVAAIEAALDSNAEGDRLRGASTISQQTAKNAFLWPSRIWLRKGLEAYFTVLIELGWPKRRILEVYLNIVEWGDGVFGAEAAARTHFHKTAASLTRHEAALLAVVLPDPRAWRPEHPGPYVAGRAAIIEKRMAVVERDGLDHCVRR
ncbi:MAG: monofunctional biosynthetic peptidoglycan transglycosylase [Azospirillaceae bacterium]|nr:monofunctional biosynthetic peptidoglycan transglycosylase [Azospirillaceae bacterium]